MIKYSLKDEAEAASVETAAIGEHIAPVPRISIQAFCESSDTAAAIQAATVGAGIPK